MPLTLPSGNVPVPVTLPLNDVLRTTRVSSYRYELLDTDDYLLGDLTSVIPGGSLEWSAYSSVKGGGSIPVRDIGTDINWLHTRVKVYALLSAPSIADPVQETPLGIFIPSTPVEAWDAGGRKWEVELFDKLTLLDEDIASADEFGRTPYSAVAGSNIIDLIVDLIEEIGETTPRIEPASLTLSADLSWEPATTRLKIINDLLEMANYFSLFTDGEGHFRAEPYSEPQYRPIAFRTLNPFTKGKTSLMSPEWQRDLDYYSVPNRFICVSQGDGEEEALVSVALNEDPNSPYSTISRGRTITAKETGVEAIDQAALDAIAARRLLDASSVTQTLPDIRHAPLPGLSVNDVVKFVNPDAGMDDICTVTNTTINLDPTELASSTLRVVAAT